jgi:hypothetical protein
VYFVQKVVGVFVRFHCAAAKLPNRSQQAKKPSRKGREASVDIVKSK